MHQSIERDIKPHNNHNAINQGVSATKPPTRHSSHIDGVKHIPSICPRTLTARYNKPSIGPFQTRLSVRSVGDCTVRCGGLAGPPKPSGASPGRGTAGPPNRRTAGPPDRQTAGLRHPRTLQLPSPALSAVRDA